jgi:hypothetical protein
MAVRALVPGQLIEHVYSGDVRPERVEATAENPQPDNSAHDDFKPSKFNLKCLDSRILGVLKDKATKITINPQAPNDEIGTQVNQNQYYFEIVQLALDSVEDFDTKGVKLTRMKRNIGGVSYSVVDPSFVGMIPDFVLAELAERVISGNSMSDDEKNA